MRTYTNTGDRAHEALDLLTKHDQATLEGSLVHDAIALMRRIVAESRSTNEHLAETEERFKKEAKLIEEANKTCIELGQAMVERFSEAVRIDDRRLLMLGSRNGYMEDGPTTLKALFDAAYSAHLSKRDKYL
jgi:outer membrane protease